MIALNPYTDERAKVLNGIRKKAISKEEKKQFRANSKKWIRNFRENAQ